MGLSAQGDIPSNVFQHVVYIPSRASNAADALRGGLLFGDVPAQLLSARFVPHASQVGSATNYADMKLVKLGSGSAGTTVMASRSYSATAQGHAKEIPAQLTLATAEADLRLSTNEQMGISFASQGNGIAIQEGELHLSYRYY